MNNEKQVLSVAGYIDLINEQLQFYQAHVKGEITQVKIWPSGHVYFTIKDKDRSAVLDCVIWKRLYALYGLKIETGMEVIISGNANIYAPSGRLSFVTQSIQLVGEGALKKAYDAVKKKLTLEGIFAEERKKKIPDFPTRVGVITSRNGAVIHDFLNNLNRHGFQITLIDTRVEGIEALPDLYRAVKTMKQKEVDVLVLMRGGGSLQSLAAFDAEILIRELASSSIPTIAAIGHHQDTPLCALAADVMVSTPTAAANLLNTSWERGAHAMTEDYHRIFYTYNNLLAKTLQEIVAKQSLVIDKFYRVIHVFSYAASHMQNYLAKLASSITRASEQLSRNSQHIFSHMGDVLISQDMELDALGKEKIMRSFTYALRSTSDTISAKEKLINVYNPMRQLQMGYSILRNNTGKVVKSIQDVTIGERIDVTTVDGIITSTVERTESKQHE